jgi:hypothetical protein
MLLSITRQHNDTQHNVTQHNDTQRNGPLHNDTQHNGIMTLSITKLMRVYSSLESSKILMSFILLSVDMLSVIMLGVMMLNADNLLAMLVGVMQSFLFLLLC